MQLQQKQKKTKKMHKNFPNSLMTCLASVKLVKMAVICSGKAIIVHIHFHEVKLQIYSENNNEKIMHIEKKKLMYYDELNFNQSSSKWL